MNLLKRTPAAISHPELVAFSLPTPLSEPIRRIGQRPSPTLQSVLSEKIGDDLVCRRSIVVEVDRVACVRVQVRDEALCVAVQRTSRLVKYTRAIAVAHDIVGLGGDCLGR